jgi:hypothetical protein
VVLERMVYELRGVPCPGLEEVTPNCKSIMALSMVAGLHVEPARAVNLFPLTFD